MPSGSVTLAAVWLLIAMSSAEECGTGWELRTGSNFCYRFEQTAKSWDDARSACQTFGGDLTAVADAGEMYYISGKIMTSTTKVWIGFVDYVYLGVWGWIDKSCVVDYTNWNTGEPTYNHGGRECAAITTFSQAQNRWDAETCSTLLPFICRKKLVGQGQAVTNTECATSCKAKYPYTYVDYVYENNVCRCLYREFFDTINNEDTSYVKCEEVSLPTTTQASTTSTTPTTTTTEPTTTTNEPATQTRRAKCKKHG